MIKISVWHGDLSDSYLKQITQLGADCIDFERKFGRKNWMKTSWRNHIHGKT